MKKRPGRRGRPPGRPLTKRELQARRENLAIARAAPQDVIYRPTEKRMAASLRNLRKALRARKSTEGKARVRLNALKHGVYSRELMDESVRLLGESEREFAAHREMFARLFVPRDEREATIIWELGNLAWRRLRLFHAQARREARELRRILADAPAPQPLDAAATEDRAMLALAALDDCERVLGDAAKLRFEFEGLLQELLRHRSAGETAFEPGAPPRTKEPGEQPGIVGLDAPPFIEDEEDESDDPA